MSDLLRLIVDVATLLFPFRLVSQSQRGVPFVFGWSPRCTLPPGVYFVLPWFTDVVPVSVVPHVYQTPVQTIGRRTFSASVVIRVVDAWAAYNTLELWHESAVELAGAVLADAVRHESCENLPAVCDRINAELAPHGIHVDRLRFLDYTESPAVRLLGLPEATTRA